MSIINIEIYNYVCAYIECEDFFTVSSNYFGGEIMYNPRKCTHWTDCDGKDLDNVKFDLLITKGNKVYDKNI